PTVATHTFQHETIQAGGGRVALASPLTVAANTQHCLSAWIRGSAGTCPFLGIQISGVEHWLIGATGYADAYGGSVTPITSDGLWHWYAKSFTTLPAETSLLLKDELWDACGPGSADFDDIELYVGECPSGPVLDPGVTT